MNDLEELTEMVSRIDHHIRCMTQQRRERVSHFFEEAGQTPSTVDDDALRDFTRTLRSDGFIVNSNELAEEANRNSSTIEASYNPERASTSPLDLPASAEFIAAAIASGVVGNFAYDALKHGLRLMRRLVKKERPLTDGEIIEHIARTAVLEQCARHDLPAPQYNSLRVLGSKFGKHGIALALGTSDRHFSADVYVTASTREGRAPVLVRINTAASREKKDWQEERVRDVARKWAPPGPESERALDELASRTKQETARPIEHVHISLPLRDVRESDLGIYLARIAHEYSDRRRADE